MISVSIFSQPQSGRKMLFVLPPATIEGKKIIPSHHPIMTATLAGVALQEGAYVGVIDAALLGLSSKELAEQILSFGAEWVAFIPFEYRREISLESALSTIEHLNNMGFSGMCGVMNASWGALEPRRAIEQKKLSFVSFGDGEPAVRAFAKSLQSPARGVLWNIHGYLEENSARPVVNWDELPVPAWSLFDHQGYRPSAHRYRLLPTLPVFASRSCPYGCDFCPQSLFNPSQKHIARSPQKVFAEIVELQKIYGIQDLEFYDPTFGIRREETIELCTLLRDLDVQWSCYTRCDLVDEPLLDLMKKAGCHTILFGVESEDEEIRGRTNKELSKEAITEAFSLCKQKGIQTIGSFIIGLPKETPASIERTLGFAKRLNPTYAQFHLARSFFVHEDWIAAGRIEEDWEVTDASVNGKAYIPHGFTQKSLSRYLFKSYLSFYLRPQKMVELFQTLENRNDVLRHLRGVQQIYRHIVG